MIEAIGAKASAANTVYYSMDPGKSRFAMHAIATGLLSSFGHNPSIAIRQYTGDVTCVLGTLEQAFVRISVQAASLEVTDDVSQKDRLEIETRMKQEVLEVSAYPEIVFESSEVSVNKLGEDRFAAKVTGNLMLHGVTHPEAIYAQVVLAGDTLRAYGEFSLRQTDYGIKLVSVAGGTLKVKDEVKITFDLTSRRQQG